jgi:hypothetical protein
MAQNNNNNKPNIKNAESPLFKGLTRLFSGPIVNYNHIYQSRYKRLQLDKFKFTSAQGLSFKKSSYDNYDSISSKILSTQNRIQRYTDFEQMEYMPEIASTLDIYADEMTTSSDLTPMLKINCPNEEIKYILQNLYFKVLNLESNLYGWCRNMCKFGDYFLYLDIDEQMGVKNVVGLPTSEVERMEGLDKTNPSYVQFQWNSGGLAFENWQIAHFRILGNDKYTPYGTSVLDPARRIFRQLTLLEDAMMAYRVVRSPERKVFYIDVGGIPPNEVEQYMQKVVTTMKRNQVVDPQTGRVDLRYNPMSVDEDYFIPVRGGAGSTKIESLPGGQFTSAIEDVKYLRDKLFSALKIPMSYLSRGEGASEDKATLAQKDIRFARTIQRLQRVVIGELEKIGIIHLYTLGFRGNDLVSFKLALSNPSKIAALQELEHWKVKFDIASAATEGFFSKRWIAHTVFGLSDEEFVRIQREQYYDRKLAKTLEAIGTAEEPTGGGGGGGLDLGGLGGGGEEAPAPEAGGAPEAPEAGGGAEAAGGEEGGGEEGVLLASPPAGAEGGGEGPAAGKRDDTYGGKKPHVSPNGKGHVYKPVSIDKRGSGKRVDSYLSSGGKSYAGIDKIYAGKREFTSLANGSIGEQQTNEDYILEEERQLFQSNYEITKLLESLEKSDNARKAKVKAQ